MSVDNGRLDTDGQARTQESPATTELPTDADGLLGRLKRHFEQWARLYVEQRVAARSGVDD